MKSFKKIKKLLDTNLKKWYNNQAATEKKQQLRTLKTEQWNNLEIRWGLSSLSDQFNLSKQIEQCKIIFV